MKRADSIPCLAVIDGKPCGAGVGQPCMILDDCGDFAHEKAVRESLGMKDAVPYRRVPAWHVERGDEANGLVFAR